ncbi:MAG: thioredoxin family protein [Pseudomonadaceae bacterium]|nr:thioredoxin family protein [Pseudomonadaceae bacterium]
MRTTTALTVLLLACSGGAHAAYDEAVEDRPCLDYWAVGNSKECQSPAKPKKPSKPPPVVPSPTTPPPQAATTSPSPTLDEKIDKFIETHGKPPREFVAFYLEPTPENAVKWVAKYNEILQRGQDLAIAWTQAEKLYDNEVKSGTPASVLNPTAYPIVPDYGIPLPGINTPAYPQMATQQRPVVPAPLGAAAAIRSESSNWLNAPATATAGVATGLLKPEVDLKADFTGKPLQVSYYFSSICPYCKKFTPDLATVVEELGERLQVTCVDVTPEVGEAHRTPNNLDGVLSCLWRPATDEEIAKLNIRQTPTLIINKGDDQQLEKISGYVDPAKLRTYFLGVLANRKE